MTFFAAHVRDRAKAMNLSDLQAAIEFHRVQIQVLREELRERADSSGGPVNYKNKRHVA